MQKQREWKILKDLKLTYPTCDKGIELLCQSTIFIGDTRYRDVILKLSKTHYRLTKTFLYEVSNHLVQVNDKNWRKRFKEIYANEIKDKEDKKDKKDGKKDKKKDNIQHLIKKEHQTKKEKEKEEEEDSSSSVVEEGDDEEEDFIL